MTTTGPWETSGHASDVTHRDVVHEPPLPPVFHTTATSNFYLYWFHGKASWALGWAVGKGVDTTFLRYLSKAQSSQLLARELLSFELRRCF